MNRAGDIRKKLEMSQLLKAPAILSAVSNQEEGEGFSEQ
jgi:hypothetical protein